MLQSSYSSPSSFLTSGQSKNKNQQRSSLSINPTFELTSNGGPGTSTSSIRESNNNNNDNSQELPRTSIDYNGNDSSRNPTVKFNESIRSRPRDLKKSIDGLPQKFINPSSGPIIPLVCQYPPRGILSFIPNGSYIVSFALNINLFKKLEKKKRKKCHKNKKSNI